MTDIAELAFKIDSRQLKQGQSDLDSFGRTSEAAGKKTKAFGSAASSALKAVAIAGTAAAIAGRALSSAQSYVTMNNSLRAIGLSGDQAAAALEQVAGVAQRTRSPLEATAALYQRISIAGRDLGASSSDVLRFTENIGLGLAQTGGSAAAASGALTQLSQAMAGGIVRAEEFNSILEGAFPIAQAAANGIDGAAGSVGRLRNMIVEGDVTSREFFDAILSQTDALEAAFANTVPTIGQALTSLNNNFIMLSGSMDQTLGVSSAIAQGILFLSDNLERLATYAAVAAVAIGVTYGGAAAIAAARTLTLSGALTFLRGAIIRTGIGALVIAAGELTFQFLKVVKATGSFGEALVLLGDVASEVFGRIAMGFDVVPLAVAAGANKMAAVFYDALRSMMIGFQDMINAVVGGLNDTFGTSLSYARGMGDGLYDMANAASAAANAASSAGNAILDSMLAPLDSVNALRDAVNSADDAINALGTGGGGGGGGLIGDPASGGAAGEKSAKAKEAQESLFADTEKQVTALKRQIEMIGMTSAEVAELTAKYALLDEAKSRGIAVTDQLSSRINAEAAEVGRLTGQYEAAQESMAALEQLNTQWKDSLIDAAMGVEGAFDGVIDAIKRAAIEYAIFGTGMFAGGGAGGGIAGSVIGGVRNFLSGKREGGGNVTAGKSYLVGERKPEVFTPTQSGRIGQVGDGGNTQNVTQNIIVSGATGNTEVRQMVAAGVQQGNAQIRKEVPGLVSRHTKVAG